MQSTTFLLLQLLFLLLSTACAEPQCRPGEIKLADTCYKTNSAKDSAVDSVSAADATSDAGRSMTDVRVDASSRVPPADASKPVCADGGCTECIPNPCASDSECVKTGAGYECNCAGTGYTGARCETPVASCASNPCMHGGKCTEGEGEAICECTGTGFSGSYCEVEVDDCAASPCMNGGKCTDAVGGYVCDCSTTGFSGTTCQSTVDDCKSNPCMHGGKCSDGVRTTTCDCTGTGYSGTRCETNVDDCSPNPCRNGGSCTDGVSGVSCACAPGYTGKLCETNIDDCAANPCQNGGRCTDLLNDVRCTCAAGFSGARCETNIDDCAVNPCQNGGTCADRVADVSCSCPAGFSGKRCEAPSCGNGTIDVGEECDWASSASAKWTCNDKCEHATLYTGCSAAAACTGAGIQCTNTGYCGIVQCNSVAECPAPTGAKVACEFRQCFLRCAKLSDCAPGTFCDQNGNCAGVQPGICATDPFACPAGSSCMNSSCFAR